MKALFALSLLCALASVVALVGLSAVTLLPGPAVETWRAHAMLFVGVLMLCWLGVAFWARRPKQAALRWLGGLLLMASIGYLLGMGAFVLA